MGLRFSKMINTIDNLVVAFTTPRGCMVFNILWILNWHKINETYETWTIFVISTSL